jgi:shikimate dehydrogenase
MSNPYAEVIGDPVDHSKSPLIHRFWLEKAGIEGDYRTTRVEGPGLSEYLAQRRTDPDWRGCNVTVPHKQVVIPLLDRMTPLAQQVGAVNLIASCEGLLGGNSDVEGITSALPSFPKGAFRQACLIGSGGAALAALAAFRLLGIPQVMLNVRDQAKGRRLLEQWRFPGRVAAVDDRDNLLGAQLIVNATTLGMTGQTAMPETLLQHVATHPDDRAVVFDMVYAPLETELLAAARRRGLRTVDGLAMLVGQAATAFAAFFQIPAPREHDAELRALLTS